MRVCDKMCKVAGWMATGMHLVNKEQPTADGPHKRRVGAMNGGGYAGVSKIRMYYVASRRLHSAALRVPLNPNATRISHAARAPSILHLGRSWRAKPGVCADASFRCPADSAARSMDHRTKLPSSSVSKHY